MPLVLLLLYSVLNMFRMLIHPSSGACDLFVELFHGFYCSGSMCVGVMLQCGYGKRDQLDATCFIITLVD